MPSPIQWREIAGSDGRYFVSNDGRVFSRAARYRPHRFLKPAERKGYNYAVLRVNAEGPCKFIAVHRLVAMAFDPESYFEGAVIRHLDGNPLNNNSENLAWGTRSENCYDTVTHGRHHSANKTHCIHGHEFTPENTQRTKRGHRRCRSCRRHQERQHPAGGRVA